MVQNQTKKCPNGSGITRSPGLVLVTAKPHTNHNIHKAAVHTLGLSDTLGICTLSLNWPLGQFSL